MHSPGGDTLTKSTSSYLVRAIEATPNIVVRLRTDVVDGYGDGSWRASGSPIAKAGPSSAVGEGATVVRLLHEYLREGVPAPEHPDAVRVRRPCGFAVRHRAPSPCANALVTSNGIRVATRPGSPPSGVESGACPLSSFASYWRVRSRPST